MKRSRFSEEQIIGILKEHQAGLPAAELGSTASATPAFTIGFRLDRILVGEAIHLIVCIAKTACVVRSVFLAWHRRKRTRIWVHQASPQSTTLSGAHCMRGG